MASDKARTACDENFHRGNCHFMKIPPGGQTQCGKRMFERF
jgi:hypothetical protein